MSRLERARSREPGSLGVRGVKLDDDEVCLIREVVGVAEGKVGRVHPAHCPVGELRGRMREDVVPPLEELGGIALGRDGVVAGTMTGGDWRGEGEGRWSDKQRAN